VILNERQQKAVARIIERHTGWTIGWSIDYDKRSEMYAKCATAIAQYLKRQRRR
jgi:hypothetical protein